MRFTQVCPPAGTFTAFMPSRGHNHTLCRSIQIFFLMTYNHQHCPSEINSRSENEKTTKQTESSTHIFIDCVSLHSDKPVHIQPVLLHLLLATQSNLHCRPTCLWAFAQDCFLWIKFVVCWICHQLYLPFQLANQCQIPLRPTFHLAFLRKNWENPCVQA